MQTLHLTNSYTRKKEEFKPIINGHVGLYVCGPTVSGESHLGHARPYVTFDVVYRYLTFLGYKVKYIRNITDAGHFEEEGREATDKVSEKAQLEKLEPMELVKKYTVLFHDAMKKLNNIDPNVEPAATAHIPEQIEMIKKIMQDGYAYEKNGSVYFDVKKYANKYPYGTLSGRKIDELLETTRELDGQDEKKNKVDFALWKKAPPEHIMRWPSPWGDGFPGWHIECSAMSSKYLGKEFDIHGGGIDLQFPHHESEIAQSTVTHGCAPARYWMHNNMITIEGKKMGKSYNNVITLREMFSGKHPLLEKAYNPMVVRFNILQTHYRSTLDFSNESLQASEKALEKLSNAHKTLKRLSYPKHTNALSLDDSLDKGILTMCKMAFAALNDDFNTAKCIAELMKLIPHINGFAYGIREISELSDSTFNELKRTYNTIITKILGLKSYGTKKHLTKNSITEQVLNILVEIRKDAKTRKDYATSDLIRNKLAEAGVMIKDEKDGSVSWTIE